MKQSEHQKWLKTRAKWRKRNPPNHQGYYTCDYCYRWVPERAMTLDHVVSRSNAPHLRHELSNLVPACFRCNSDKGSLSAEQYRKRLTERKQKRIIKTSRKDTKDDSNL